MLNTIEDVLAESTTGLADDGTDGASTDSEALSGMPTIFNGIEVPPMKELPGEAFDTEIKDGHWYVIAVSHHPPSPIELLGEL